MLFVVQEWVNKNIPETVLSWKILRKNHNPAEPKDLKKSFTPYKKEMHAHYVFGSTAWPEIVGPIRFL